MFWIRTIMIFVFVTLLRIGGITITDWVWWPIAILFAIYGVLGLLEE